MRQTDRLAPPGKIQTIRCNSTIFNINRNTDRSGEIFDNPLLLLLFLA